MKLLLISLFLFNLQYLYTQSTPNNPDYAELSLKIDTHLINGLIQLIGLIVTPIIEKLIPAHLDVHFNQTIEGVELEINGASLTNLSLSFKNASILANNTNEIAL